MVKSVPERNIERLFDSYPHGTLAFMAAGCGVIAVATLGLEVWTGQVLARALGMSSGFVSAPLGVATVVLSALLARVQWRWAFVALGLGVAYWVSFMYLMMH